MKAHQDSRYISISIYLLTQDGEAVQGFMRCELVKLNLAEASNVQAG